jgi:2,3-bisphosphoglycerate-dependent phosphoglycerate mutase
MELVLIRHGLPMRVENEPGTPADPPLSEEGREQARRVAEWLAPEGFDVVYSSPMRRAIETARPLADLLGLEVVVDEELAELDRDHHFYVPVEELKATGDPRYDQLLKGELYGDVDIETWSQVAALAVQRVLEAHPGQRIALFAHGGVINAYLARLLGLETTFFFGPGYTSVSRVKMSDYSDRIMLHSLNELAHLRASDVSSRG